MQDKMQQAVLAQQVLDNPVYRQTMTVVKAKIFDDWCSTRFYQQKKRDDLWRMMRIADTFEALLSREITTGKLAERAQND